MSASRFGRLQKASAVVPLALISVAWTANLAGVTATSAQAESDPTAPVPSTSDAATSVPSQAIDAPASVSVEEAGSPGFSGNAKQIVSTASTNGIPSAALAAYQRAETVINNADAGCNITWQLVAAIGRVESNHGRFAGSSLDAKGIASPAILGPVLNGKAATSAIADTDAGALDGDKKFDRAVGPMQFIPSTWAVVGVDADNDGKRDPQDIDDAALAAAVYLCSGDDDLSTTAGQREAVYRYNHSQAYVTTVLGVMDAYLAGDYMPVPNSTVAAGYLTPLPPSPVKNDVPRNDDTSGADDETEAADPVEEPTAPIEPNEPNEPTEPNQPSNPGNDNSNDGKGNDDKGDKGPGIKLPDIKVPDVPKTGIEPVDGLLTKAEATVQCTLDLVNYILSLNYDEKFDKCVTGYTKP